MNNLEKQIQAALRDHNGDDSLGGEPNLAEEIITAFRGRHRWATTLAFVFSIGFLTLAVWAGCRFYGAETVREQLLWGALAMGAVLFIAFMKVWFWLEMQSNRILRELKRMELMLLSRGPVRPPVDTP